MTHHRPPRPFTTWLDAAVGTFPNTNCSLDDDVPFEYAESEAKAELASLRLVKGLVVDTIGGFVEGRPTQEINYLQRLRKLVELEKAVCAKPSLVRLLPQEMKDYLMEQGALTVLAATGGGA